MRASVEAGRSAAATTVAARTVPAVAAQNDRAPGMGARKTTRGSLAAISSVPPGSRADSPPDGSNLPRSNLVATSLDASSLARSSLRAKVVSKAGVAPAAKLLAVPSSSRIGVPVAETIAGRADLRPGVVPGPEMPHDRAGFSPNAGPEEIRQRGQAVSQRSAKAVSREAATTGGTAADTPALARASIAPGKVGDRSRTVAPAGSAPARPRAANEVKAARAIASGRAGKVHRTGALPRVPADGRANVRRAAQPSGAAISAVRLAVRARVPDPAGSPSTGLILPQPPVVNPVRPVVDKPIAASPDSQGPVPGLPAVGLRRAAPTGGDKGPNHKDPTQVPAVPRAVPPAAHVPGAPQAGNQADPPAHHRVDRAAADQHVEAGRRVVPAPAAPAAIPAGARAPDPALVLRVDPTAARHLGGPPHDHRNSIPKHPLARRALRISRSYPREPCRCVY